MAVDTSNWQLLPGGPGNQGILSWTGPGGAPATDAGTQRALRGSLTMGSAPISSLPGVSSTPQGTMPGMEGGGGSNPGIVNYSPGPITSIVNDLLTASIFGGSGGGAPGKTLNMLAAGQIPDATLAAYRQNQALEDASITEKLGVVGNRFGTDLTRTLADAAGRSNVNLSAQAMDRALAAISQIIGLGTGQSNLEFAGNQAALDRANQGFLSAQQNSGLPPWLLALLAQGI